MADFISQLQAALAQNLSPEEYHRWVKPLAWDYNPIAAELKLCAPTSFHRKVVAGYLDHLAALADKLRHPLEKLTVESLPKGGGLPVSISLAPSPQTQNHQPISNEHSFERFLEGPSNRLAHLAMTDWVQGPVATSLLLLAPGPWGKTHLLDALALKLRETPHRRFKKCSGADPIPSETSDWLSMDVVIIDDIHLLQSSPDLQERLIKTFDQARGRPLSLIMAAPEFPTNLNEALQSRLGGGLVLKVGALEYELLLNLGLRRAQELKLDIPLETLSVLAREAQGDPRRLVGFLETLNFIISRTGLSLMEALSRLSPDRNSHSSAVNEVAVDTIIEATAEAFGLKISDLTGQSRLKQTAWPRRVAMLLAREMTSMTTTQIGQAFGGRDHSTVIHALKKIHQELKSPAQVKIIETIKQSIYTRVTQG